MPYILFSPVGGHDPIASYHDGAVLHICRVYKPEKVYLYLSHEMLERSKQDDRYRLSLERLQRQMGHVMELHMIERDELTQVQLFDTFYTDFDQLLREIHDANPDSTLLVNLSSGTPAMKSALNVISVLAQYPMQAVQVSTPNKRENPKDEDPKDYDVDAFWELDQDNEPDFTNRCHEVEGEHLLVKIKKESIRRLLDAYNYKAALLLAQDIAEFIPADTMRMMQAAECRLQLDKSGYTKAMQGMKHKFTPIEMSDHRQIFEYVLSLQIKMRQGNYADFLRGLTPVVLDLFTMCLRDQLGITPDQFCSKMKKGGYKVDTAVMQRTERGREIRQALKSGMARHNNRYGTRYTDIQETVLNSMQICFIFEGMLPEGALLDDICTMRENVESKLRNIAAHEIESVTDDWIYRQTRLHAEDIMKLLKRLVLCAGVKVRNDYWNSYADMNRIIAENL